MSKTSNFLEAEKKCNVKGGRDEIANGDSSCIIFFFFTSMKSVIITQPNFHGEEIE